MKFVSHRKTAVQNAHSSVFQARSRTLTIFGEIFTYVKGKNNLLNYRGSHIPSSWTVHVGFLFIADIYRLGHKCQVALSPCAERMFSQSRFKDGHHKL